MFTIFMGLAAPERTVNSLSSLLQSSKQKMQHKRPKILEPVALWHQYFNVTRSVSNACFPSGYNVCAVCLSVCLRRFDGIICLGR